MTLSRANRTFIAPYFFWRQATLAWFSKNATTVFYFRDRWPIIIIIIIIIISKFKYVSVVFDTFALWPYSDPKKSIVCFGCPSRQSNMVIENPRCADAFPIAKGGVPLFFVCRSGFTAQIRQRLQASGYSWYSSWSTLLWFACFGGCNRYKHIFPKPQIVVFHGDESCSRICKKNTDKTNKHI